MWPPDPISVASQEQRRHPRGSGDRSDSALQRRQALFEHRHGRVGDPAVDVALALEIEESGCVFDVAEQIGRGLVDRNGSGPEVRVWLVAGMQRQRLEVQEFRVDHSTLLAFGAQPTVRRLRVRGRIRPSSA